VHCIPYVGIVTVSIGSPLNASAAMVSTDLEVFCMYCYNNVDKITADKILCSEDDNDSTTEHMDDIVQYKCQ
jgi:hypothetical protein